MSKSLPTVEELISYLSRSSLNTLVVEGDDDVIYLRSIENHIDDINALPAGGKSCVLQIFDRKDELRPTTLFLVDSDEWAVGDIPNNIAECEEIFITNGYSLENDLIRDSNVIELLSAAERLTLREILNIVDDLMASAIGRPRAERFDFGKRLSSTFSFETRELTAAAQHYCAANEADERVMQLVKADPAKFYRGKTLLQILSRIFSERQNGRKIEVYSVLETAWTNPTGYVATIAQNIKSRLENSGAVA